MRNTDFSPLFRSSVGFDRMTRMLDAASRATDTSQSGYPPYNIEKLGEDAYRVTMAVAGFAEKDIEITAHQNSLVITGKPEKDESEEERTWLHRGIAGRAFERRFDLADHIRVADASLENGLLHVDLVREVPEALKPRRISINTGAPAIESKAA